MARAGCHEFADVSSDAVFRGVSEELSSRFVDEQQHAVEVVRADQAEAVLDQLTVAVVLRVRLVTGLRFRTPSSRFSVGTVGRLISQGAPLMTGTYVTPASLVL